MRYTPAFSEGWIDAAGTDIARRDLAQEALFLGRVVTAMLPEEPEALGFLALMLPRGSAGTRVAMRGASIYRFPSRMLREGTRR
jgi:predicted RNA polymerase sigma factor